MKKTPEKIEPAPITINDRIAFTIVEAAEVSGLGRSSICKALSNGLLPARKNGKSTLIRASDLRAWIDAMPAWEPWRPSSGRQPGGGLGGRRRRVPPAGPLQPAAE
jgi:excisionase family DNA binding protein